METEKRTAEEILNALEKSDTDKHFPAHTYEQDYAGGTCVYYRDDLVTKAMNQYASQELAAEHDKARNQAIQDCIAHVHGYCNATTADTLVKKLEQLKTKP